MSDHTWIEISLTVEGELVEPVTEVLSRYVPGGVVIESTAVTANPDDSEGHSIGPLRVAAYLPDDDSLEETRQKIEQALWYLGRIQPLPVPEYRTILESDWSQAWKQHYQPITIGQRLAIVPAWLENPHPDRVVVRIDPGMAFGTGTHPTTQLCLEYLEEILSVPVFRGPVSEINVIDLGCGTAILAVAALKLGAHSALGIDNDPIAIRAARENALANQATHSLELGVGSLAEILHGHYSLTKAHLVLANILASVLERLLDEGLADLLEPGGFMVLSGILDEQVASLEKALERHGLQVASRKNIQDWVALAVSHKST